MNHYTVAKFWEYYHALPTDIQALADKNYELLKENPYHLSLHLKKIDEFWSVRVTGLPCAWIEYS